jgi:hypothetical protein
MFHIQNLMFRLGGVPKRVEKLLTDFAGSPVTARSHDYSMTRACQRAAGLTRANAISASRSGASAVAQFSHGGAPPSLGQERRARGVKMSVGAARRPARASGTRRFLSVRRREFATIDPGQTLSSAPVEP